MGIFDHIRSRGSNRHHIAKDDSQMDIDQPEPHPHGSLAQYSIPHDDNGPVRKRKSLAVAGDDIEANCPPGLHSEIQTPPLRSFNAPSTGGHTLYIAEDSTPFLFHAAGIHVRPNPPAVPQTSSFRQPHEVGGKLNFGFPSTSALFSEDVEMKDAESPARPRAARVEDEPEQQDEKGGEAVKEKSKEPKIAKGSEGSQGTLDGKSETNFNMGQRPIAKGAIKRVQKRRQREYNQGNQGPIKTEHTYNINTNPTMRHSEIPALLLGYLQFFVNAAVVFFVLYLAVQFVLTVRRDVQDKMAEASIDILQEISECSQLYLTNRCDPTLRVPAMEAPCRAWEACMNRDPTMVGRTNVLAETFAGVINSFVDPISWKTMGFTLVTLSFLIILTNSALFDLRLRAAPDVPPPPPTPQHMYPSIHAPWMPGGPNQHSHGYMNHGYQQAIHSGQYGQGQGNDSDGLGSGPLAIKANGENGDTKKKGWLW